MDYSPRMHKESTRLAFDCSMVGVSAALLHQGRCYERHDHSANKQASQLLPMISSLLEEAGIHYSAIETLVTTYGPGSFTGIRIGLAAAQGLLAAVPMQVVALTGLEAMAISAAHTGLEGKLWVCASAGKGEIYAQLFHVKQAEYKALNDIALLSPSDFLAVYANEALAGNAAALLPSITPDSWQPNITLPHAADFISSNHPASPVEALVPLYIRAPDAKLPAVPLPLE